MLVRGSITSVGTKGQAARTKTSNWGSEAESELTELPAGEEVVIARAVIEKIEILQICRMTRS